MKTVNDKIKVLPKQPWQDYNCVQIARRLKLYGNSVNDKIWVVWKQSWQD